MSKLRDHLSQARRAYEADRYPGDLAADLLPSPLTSRPGRTTMRLVAAVAGALATAAAVVVAFRTADPSPAARVAVAPTRPGKPGVSVRPAWPAYPFPDRMPLALPAAPLVPVTPPLTVSLTALNDLRTPYEGLGPRLRQRLNWSNLMQPSGGTKAPVPPTGSDPTTQQAV